MVGRNALTVISRTWSKSDELSVVSPIRFSEMRPIDAIPTSATMIEKTRNSFRRLNRLSDRGRPLLAVPAIRPALVMLLLYGRIMMATLDVLELRGVSDFSYAREMALRLGKLT